MNILTVRMTYRCSALCALVISLLTYSCNSDDGFKECRTESIFPESVFDLMHEYTVGDTVSFVHLKNGVSIDTLHFQVNSRDEGIRSITIFSGTTQCDERRFTSENIVYNFTHLSGNKTFKVEYVSHSPSSHIGQLVIQLDSIYLFENITDGRVFNSIGNKLSPDYLEKINILGQHFNNVWSGFEHYEEITYTTSGMKGVNDIGYWDSWYSPDNGVVKFYSDDDKLELLP